MPPASTWRTVAIDARARTLEQRWQKLCARYLPVADSDSIWNYHLASADLPDSGWKLHIPATILNAPRVLQRVAPVLADSRVQFKVARSLTEVSTLNSGLLHTYSQVGKVITVYPRNDEQAVYLAQLLHKLTSRFRSPAVPFDLRFSKTSNVYYRYGAFKKIEIHLPDGRRALGLKSPSGELVPDVRENPKPEWVVDPIATGRPENKKRKPNNEKLSAFHVLGALVQRGKGGVYQAIDIQSNPPRLCLLKEGRRHGEVSWDGRDGAWRVRNEERVLSRLLDRGVKVPRVYSRFESEDNFYLVMEFVDGQNLHDLLVRQTRRLSLKTVVSLGVQVAGCLAQMHRAGWAWRDCKPKNLIITREGKLVPIDFEGASPIKNPDSVIWGTRGFLPAESPDGVAQTAVSDDLYALGSILYLLITGRVFEPEQPIAIEKLRRSVSPELRQLVGLLLDKNPRHRPSAQSAYTQLNSILLKYSQAPRKLVNGKAA